MNALIARALALHDLPPLGQLPELEGTPPGAIEALTTLIESNDALVAWFSGGPRIEGLNADDRIEPVLREVADLRLAPMPDGFGARARAEIERTRMILRTLLGSAPVDEIELLLPTRPYDDFIELVRRPTRESSTGRVQVVMPAQDIMLISVEVFAWIVGDIVAESPEALVLELDREVLTVAQKRSELPFHLGPPAPHLLVELPTSPKGRTPASWALFLELFLRDELLERPDLAVRSPSREDCARIAGLLDSATAAVLV